MNIIDVTGATYLQSYMLRIEFSDNTFRIIDFEPFFKNHHNPQWDRYNKIGNFRKFKIENGNLVWGRNWDLIFPVSGLYTGNILEPCC